MWTEEQWRRHKRLLAEQRERKTRTRPAYFGLATIGKSGRRSGTPMINDVFGGEGPPAARQPTIVPPTPEPAPDESLALAPEVIEPVRRECEGCARGDLPHRAAHGQIRKGHSTGRPKGSMTSTRPAEEALRRAGAKAVSTLIKALDDPNPWVALTAARTICERVIPVVVEQDPDRGPVLVFPPGTAISLLPDETRDEIIALRRRVEG